VNQLAISRKLAYAFGVLTPLAEIVRRWGTWWVNPPAFLDDFLIGAFLVAGAWATRKTASSGARSLLAAAWGFACGMAYSSITYHWYAMRTGQSDPAPIPTAWVFAIKLCGGLVFLVALVLTLRHRDIEPAVSSAPSHRTVVGPDVARDLRS
jgi:hypothetical protein